MCLAIPGRVEKIFESEDAYFRNGLVSFGQVNKEINLCMVPEVKPGDYVLVHVGVAISTIDEEEAQKTFEYLKQIDELNELEPEE